MTVEHSVSRRRFGLEVFQDAPVPLGRDHIDMDGMLLPVPPATPHALIVLLERMSRELRDVGALLKVQTPPADALLCHQHPYLAVRKGEQALLFLVVGMTACHLNSVRDELFQQIALVVQIAPNQRWLAGVNKLSHFLAAFHDRPPPFLPLLFEPDSRDGEQVAFPQFPAFDYMLSLRERRQYEISIAETEV